MKKILLALMMFTTTAFAANEPGQEMAAKRLDLALAMIESLDRNEVCETDSYPSEINQLVQTAWYNATEKKQEEFLGKIAPDSIIRQDLAFRVAVGQVIFWDADLTAEQFAEQITGTVYHGFGQGVFGSRYNVELKAGGVASQNKMESLEQEPWYRWIPSVTSWSVRKEKNIEGSERFVLRIENEDFVVRNEEAGVMWWQPVANEGKEDVDYEKTISSSNSYCEA